MHHHSINSAFVDRNLLQIKKKIIIINIFKVSHIFNIILKLIHNFILTSTHTIGIHIDANLIEALKAYPNVPKSQFEIVAFDPINVDIFAIRCVPITIYKKSTKVNQQPNCGLT